jgi:hypothetical protein
MSEKYFFIERMEDEPSCGFLSKQTLETKLKELMDTSYPYNFLKELPRDLSYCPSNSIFIMRGEVVIPKAEKVVTKWKV